MQDRCFVKITFDDGKTWFPSNGPIEFHIAGQTYVLLMNGRYVRKQ